MTYLLVKISASNVPKVKSEFEIRKTWENPFKILNNIFAFFFSVCIYQPGKDVEWTPCASPQDQVKTKTLKLIKSKVEKCPEIKVLSKNCKDGKKNHKKATGA